MGVLETRVRLIILLSSSVSPFSIISSSGGTSFRFWGVSMTSSVISSVLAESELPSEDSLYDSSDPRGLELLTSVTSLS